MTDTPTPEEQAREITEHIDACVSQWSDRATATNAITAALRAEYERGQADMRLKAQAAAFTAQLPSHYRWGHDAMEQFNFGKKRAYLAIAALPITTEKEGGE